MTQRVFHFILLLLCTGYAATAQAVTIQSITTPSGITAWLVEDHAIPLVSAEIIIRNAGSAYDPSGLEGRANLAAGLITEGTQDKDSQTFNTLLEQHAIRLNARSEEDHLVIQLSSLKEHAALAFNLLGEVLRTPRLEEESLVRLKRQSLSILAQQEQSPHFIAMQRWLAHAYGEHPYARLGVGTKEGLQAIERHHLQDYWQRYIAQDQLVIAVVGAIDAATLTQLLESHFAALPTNATPDSALGDVQVQSHKKPITTPFDIPQSIIVFGAQGLKREDPDYIPAFVMNEILGGGGLTSQLAHILRETHGLTYHVGSALVPLAHGGRWQGQLATRSDKTEEAVLLLRKTLHEFAEQGPSEEALSRAKSYLTGSFMLKLDGSSELASFLNVMQVQKLGIDYIDRRNALINTVTRPQIIAAARRLLSDEALLITITGK